MKGEKKMIKPIEKLPETLSQRKDSYRARMRADIQQAIDSRTAKFEFVGDYNYKYLAQYAREQARKVFLPYFNQARKDAAETIKQKLGLDTCFISSQYELDYCEQFIRISSVKGPERRHVYAEINFDILDNLEEMLLERVMKEYQKKQEKSIKK